MKLGARVGGACLGVVAAMWVLSRSAGFDVVADVAPNNASQGPSADAWLGTDHLGRDVLWRLITGSEAFVGPAVLACAVAAALGVPGGALAGYTDGLAPRLVRWSLTVVASVPRLVLVLLVASIYGSEPAVLAAAVGAAWAPSLAEAVRGRVQSLRRAEFVLAARAHGHSTASILGRHVLWVNCRRLVGRNLLHLFGFFAVVESTLSYIGGFGVEEPQPSWGNMLAFEIGIHDGNLLAVAAPAAALWVTVLGAALAGEALTESGRE